VLGVSKAGTLNGKPKVKVAVKAYAVEHGERFGQCQDVGFEHRKVRAPTTSRDELQPTSVAANGLIRRTGQSQRSGATSGPEKNADRLLNIFQVDQRVRMVPLSQSGDCLVPPQANCLFH
jgi:hypothetical protein